MVEDKIHEWNLDGEKHDRDKRPEERWCKHGLEKWTIGPKEQIRNIIQNCPEQKFSETKVVNLSCELSQKDLI